MVSDVRLSVYLEGYGLADTKGDFYQYTSIYIDSISPTSGSKYGGTVVTITGDKFDLRAETDPVKFGDNTCNIISASATEIICRIELNIGKDADDEVDVVIMPALPIDSMVCLIDDQAKGDGCIFTFAEAVSGVVYGGTRVTADGTYQYVFEATGLVDGDTTYTEFWVN